MQLNPDPVKDPLYLLVLRVLVYSGVVLLLVGPLAGTVGLGAALTAVVLGLLLSRRLAASSLRWPVLLAGAVAGILLGLVAEYLLGNAAWLTRLLGIPATLAVLDGLTFGLIALGTVFGLRSLAARARPLAVLEGGLVVGVVVYLMAGHRDAQIQQPMALADWAWTRGYNPLHVYLAIGLATLGALTLLFLATRRGKKALAAILLLWSLVLLLFLFIYPLLPACAPEAPSLVAQPNQKPDSPQPPQPGLGPKPPLPPGTEPPQPVGKPQLDPGPRGDWPSQPRPLAIVLLHKDYSPVEQLFYFRDGAYSQLHNGRLIQAEKRGVDRDVYQPFPTAPIDLPEEEEAFDRGTVPTTVLLLAKHPFAFGLINATRLEPCPNPNPQAILLAYKVQSRAVVPLQRGGRQVVPYEALAACPAGNPTWPEAIRQHYLAHPDDKRYRDLSAEIVAGIDEHQLPFQAGRTAGLLATPLGTGPLTAVSAAAGKVVLPSEYRKSPYLRALALRRWIEKHVTYALKADHSESADVAASVLFGNRRGHCVHVAYALAYLLRAQGIPSRVASGYAVEAGSRGTGSSLLVQETHGHAWCEIYLHGAGWVVVDAALENSEDGPPPPVDSNLQKLYGELARGHNPDGSTHEPGGIGLAGLLMWSLTFPLLLVAGLYLVKVWRRLCPRFVPARWLYRVGYRAALDRLAEVGLARGYGETREEFAQRLANLGPGFLTLTSAHLRQAVGGVATLDRREWLELLAQVDAALARLFSAGRRGLGLLNPVSWLRVR